MTLYLDTSALVKLYVDEPKSEVVRIAERQGEAVATSLLAYAESKGDISRVRSCNHTFDLLPSLAHVIVRGLSWSGSPKRRDSVCKSVAALSPETLHFSCLDVGDGGIGIKVLGD